MSGGWCGQLSWQRVSARRLAGNVSWCVRPHSDWVSHISTARWQSILCKASSFLVLLYRSYVSWSRHTRECFRPGLPGNWALLGAWSITSPSASTLFDIGKWILILQRVLLGTKARHAAPSMALYFWLHFQDSLGWPSDSLSSLFRMCPTSLNVWNAFP